MSGRFAGSKSLDDRRRRRIAADETRTTPAETAGEPEKPLPTRRPTGRFPLRRVVSRSPWKLAGIGLTALAACGAALAAGYWPPARSGVYGPGLAALCADDAARLTTVLGGLLLLATAQLAWLIRWARARSLRDFRGGYRVWWWTATALALGGFALLIDGHVALGATLAWLTGRTPLGSDVLFRLLPAAAAILILLPSLQRDMRGCRTSRTLALGAVALWLTGGIGLLVSSHVAAGFTRLGLTLPVEAATTGLLLTGTVAAFTAGLFHARHVVYESVEPPDLPVRKKKVVAVAAEEPTAEVEVEKKPKRAASRRSSRAKAEPTVKQQEPEPKSAKMEKAKAAPAEEAPVEPITKPHFPVEPQAEKAEPAPKPEPAAAKTSAKPAPAAVASKSTPSEHEDWSDEEDAAEIGGRQFRLDGPEDPLRGLSKRERRKLRKAMKDRERAEM